MKYTLSLLPCLVLFTLASAQRIPLVNSQESLAKAAVLNDSGKFDLAIKELLMVPQRDTNYVLSQSRLARMYFNNKELDLAYATAEKVLAKRSAYRAEMLEMKATVHETRAEYDKALAILKSALEEFPFDVSLRYMVARTYQNSSDFGNAAKAYFETMKISPFTYNVHANLANIAVLTGRKTEAMFSLAMYVALVPDNNTKLQLLDNIANNEISDEGTQGDLKGISNAFERLDQVLKSKVALDKKFKTEVPIDVPTVRQFEMLFQQLNTVSPGTDDPWVNMYLPVFTAIRDQGMVEPFLYHILTSSKIAAVEKWNSKNEKKREAFFKVVNGILGGKRSTVQLPPSLNMGASVHAEYFDSQSLYGIGEMVNGQKNSKWIYYFENGERSAYGSYNNGKKVGEWKYFDKDGTINATENEETGEIIKWYPNGVMERRYFTKDGKASGDVNFYFQCGAPSERISYKDGTRTGKGQLFHKNGVVKADYEYLENKLLSWTEYNQLGKVAEKTSYKNGEREGLHESFWPNGQLHIRDNYVAGKVSGPAESHYNNGQLEFKGQYANGLPQGEWFYYNRKGEKVEQRFFNKEGNLDKENTAWREGKMYSRYLHNNGMIVEASYYDLSGKEIFKAGSPDGNFDMKQYYNTGQLWTEGKYKNGKKDGEWKQYYVDGLVQATYNYKEGEFHGEQVDKYRNGNKKLVTTYKEGVKDGYEQQFFFNETVSREGWVVDGQTQQQWRSYFANGKLQDDYYYINGSAVDSAYAYGVDEKLATKSFYVDGESAYDSMFNSGLQFFVARPALKEDVALKYANGNQLAKYSMACGMINNDLKRFYPDGQTLKYKSEYVNGVYHGPYQEFDELGRKTVDGKYLLSSEDGRWTLFNELGKKTQRIVYNSGTIDSTMIGYYSFGALAHTIEYNGESRDGLTRIFGPDGTPLVEKLYNDGQLYSVRSTGKNGQFGEWRTFLPQFEVVAYYPDGIKGYEEQFVNGTLSGRRGIYFPDGKLCMEYHFIDGEHTGPFTDYYPNGKMSLKGEYRFDELQGVVEIFGENGMKIKTVTYELGVKHGPSVIYDKDVKSKEVFYYNGFPVK